MSYILSEHKISATPKEMTEVDTRDADHLTVGCRVAITQDGWREHRSHKLWSKVAIGSTIGLVGLPFLAGFGGVGMAVGGEAIGISVAEIGIIGSGLGAGGGRLCHKEDTKYGHRLSGVSFIDLVGVVRQIKPRLLGERGYDVQVAWMSTDNHGEASVIFTEWHNPSELYTVVPE